MWAMSKRVILFSIVNILVFITLSISFSFAAYYFGFDPSGIQGLLGFYVLIGMGGSIISLMMSKWTAKKFMGVKVIDPKTTNQEERWLIDRVYEYSRKAKLPVMPEVGFYNSPEVNAFATGPSKKNSLVAVSAGLMQNMNKDEVEGVLAHEVAHIANGDMVTMALVQGVVNAFVMFFARVAAFALQNAMRSDDDESPASGGIAYYITTFIFEIFFGLLSSFIYFLTIRSPF